jgi:hypothetical protein
MRTLAWRECSAALLRIVNRPVSGEQKNMKKGRFPSGWDEDRVKRVLSHYESQSEEEAVAEDEAAWEDSSRTFIEG